ncbi:hypothetical protein ASG40_09525 [Methylobacterium sp. Leaf399]|uniref:flagellar hook-length control protein FliK n=1 Tax=Methylobacterium sp. Leaf399 TaxID=1736364 RepID=UPI0006F5DEFF|nr:flagellar hook-length control protein FliK [Methylobacterium sp. Leaf399]KQT09954.1 hypothetical protein ASG40_09525 [Methylobacterium sp. Leaf399]
MNTLGATLASLRPAVEAASGRPGRDDDAAAAFGTLLGSLAGEAVTGDPEREAKASPAPAESEAPPSIPSTTGDAASALTILAALESAGAAPAARTGPAGAHPESIATWIARALPAAAPAAGGVTPGAADRSVVGRSADRAMPAFPGAPVPAGRLQVTVIAQETHFAPVKPHPVSLLGTLPATPPAGPVPTVPTSAPTSGVAAPAPARPETAIVPGAAPATPRPAAALATVAIPGVGTAAGRSAPTGPGEAPVVARAGADRVAGDEAAAPSRLSMPSTSDTAAASLPPVATEAVATVRSPLDGPVSSTPVPGPAASEMPVVARAVADGEPPAPAGTPSTGAPAPAEPSGIQARRGPGATGTPPAPGVDPDSHERSAAVTATPDSARPPVDVAPTATARPANAPPAGPGPLASAIPAGVAPVAPVSDPTPMLPQAGTDRSLAAEIASGSPARAIEAERPVSLDGRPQAAPVPVAPPATAAASLAVASAPSATAAAPPAVADPTVTEHRPVAVPVPRDPAMAERPTASDAVGEAARQAAPTAVAPPATAAGSPPAAALTVSKAVVDAPPEAAAIHVEPAASKADGEPIVAPPGVERPRVAVTAAVQAAPSAAVPSAVPDAIAPTPPSAALPGSAPSVTPVPPAATASIAPPVASSPPVAADGGRPVPPPVQAAAQAPAQVSAQAPAPAGSLSPSPPAQAPAPVVVPARPQPILTRAVAEPEAEAAASDTAPSGAASRMSPVSFASSPIGDVPQPGVSAEGRREGAQPVTPVAALAMPAVAMPAAADPARQVADAVVAEAGRLHAPAATAGAASGLDGPLRILTIQLRPDDMGTVVVRMRLRGDALEVSLHASREETAALLRSDDGALREVLRSAGYQPDVVTIGSGRPDTASGDAARHGGGADAAAQGGRGGDAAPGQSGRRQSDPRETERSAHRGESQSDDATSAGPGRSGRYL